MDSPIQGPLQVGGYATHYLSRPSKDKDSEAQKPFSLEDGEADVVLEPQPRRADGDVSVSRERLEDEAGQIIDLRG